MDKQYQGTDPLLCLDDYSWTFTRDDPEQLYKQQVLQVIAMAIWFHIKDYCDNSSIHGLRYLTEQGRHWIERVFWFLAVVLSCYGTYLLTKASYIAYQYHAISFATETDYLYWNTSFPAVSVCETADEEKIYDYVDNYESVPKRDFQYALYLHEIGYYQGFCEQCKKYCIKGYCPTNYTLIVQKLRKKCDTLITNCRWNGEIFDCCSKFIPLNTEYGPCFTINARNDATKKSPEMISNRFTGPGSLDFDITTMSRIFLHSAEDVPFVNQPFDETFEVKTHGQVISLRFMVKEIENDPRVPLVDLNRRDCRFPYENYLWSYPYYSYSTCIVQCRAQEMLKLCNCTQHFIPNSENSTCDHSGLSCIGQYPKKLWSLRTEWYTQKEGLVCDCSASCTEPEYTIVYMKEDTNSEIDTHSEINIKMHALPTERFKRNVIRSKLDLVVSIGGTAGLFLGASLLSVVEVLIFFCVRTCSLGTKMKSKTEFKQEDLSETTGQDIRPSFKKAFVNKHLKREFF